MALYRGLKAEAERLAKSIRQELRLGVYDRLDPYRLADHLFVPVLSLRDLVNFSAGDDDLLAAVQVLEGGEKSALSAATVFCGSRRTIVHNAAHSPGRQANNITHELSHSLLLHPPAPALDRGGCRNWNQDYEDQANRLAGALLIPDKAAWWIAKRQVSFEVAAAEYGCSVDVVHWRVNITGARRLLAR
jgi:hypothetical protein